MTKIGAGWLKEDKNKDLYISVKLDDAILPLTITQDKKLMIRPNKNKENGSSQPDYHVDLFVPDKTSGQKEDIDRSDFPF